jgi:hypothetical protein
MNAIEGKLYAPFLKETRRTIIKPGFILGYETEKEWTRFGATVNKIRITEGLPIKTFQDLVEEVAVVTLNNKNYEMFYRGQTHDYKDSQGIFYKDKTPKTVVYPSICRPDKKEDGTYKASIRKSQIIKRYEKMNKMIELAAGKYQRMDEFYLSLFQHYDVLPTPFIDITQSLRIAATFALRKSATGHLYVFGLPYPNGSISYFTDQSIVLIKLQNISPRYAYRPRYQEGYLVGKFPIRPTKDGGDNLARRLVAKFYLDNSRGDFWDENFKPMPEKVLFPDNDKFEVQMNQLKHDFEIKYSAKKR